MVMLPTGMVPGLLSPKQEAAVRQQAQQNALLNFGLQALAGSQAVGYKPSTLQVLGQAGQSGLQAYQGTFDQQLQNMLRQQQMAEAQRKQRQEALRQQQLEAFIAGLPEAEQARFRAFPTQAAEAMFREVKPAPGVVGEYNAAVQSGLITPETTLEQYVAMKKPPGTTVNVGAEATPFQKKAQEGQATTFVEIERAANTARNSLRTANQLEKYLSRVDTGATAALKQFAGNFGIETEGLSDIQAAQALINRLVPQQRPPGSGTMSDADLALFKQSLPRIINQPGGNERIIKSIKEVNEYLIEEGKIARDVLAGKLTPEQGTMRMEALKNPLEDIVEQAPMPQGVTVRRVR